MEEAEKADRVIVLDGGKKLLEGKPSDVFAQADALKSAGLIPPLYVRVRDAFKDSLSLPAVGDEEQLAEALCR